MPKKSLSPYAHGHGGSQPAALTPADITEALKDKTPSPMPADALFHYLLGEEEQP